MSNLYDTGKREYFLHLLVDPQETNDWYFTQTLNSPLHRVMQQQVAEIRRTRPRRGVSGS
jgi:hypothetical protein